MSFKLTHELLRAVCERNLFPVPETGMVFFGLRGCLPLDPEDYSFAESRDLKVADVNYRNPRCTLGQWLPDIKKLAVFPGSTCPNESLVASAKKEGGQGSNQLLTGYYTFVKGEHHVGKPSGHKAFRQEEDRVVLRNKDDMDFDFYDVLSSGVQYDNLHCGFSAGVSSGYSSAGCQVVVGFPNRNDGEGKESGPWSVFRQTAYKLPQNTFHYVLLRGRELEAMAQAPDLVRPFTIRFGSEGDLVLKVQKELRRFGLGSIVPNGSCGPGMQMAIVNFQISKMGADNADGIFGANTAVQLGLTDWPTVGKQPPMSHDGTPIVVEREAPADDDAKTTRTAEAFKAFLRDHGLPKMSTLDDDTRRAFDRVLAALVSAGADGPTHADSVGQLAVASAPVSKPAAGELTPDGKFADTLVRVLNRGTPKPKFLQDLVAWAKKAPDEIFVDKETKEKDVYASIMTELGPFDDILHRKACMLEVMRVLAGFESSWNWNCGIDTTREAATTKKNAEAGAWQVSAGSLDFGQDLQDLVEREVGNFDGVEFQRAMKAKHPLAMEYVARLMRHTMRHNGPLYRDRSKFKPELQGKEQSIYPWLSRAAVAEFQKLLT
jgi:hypothetical protein